MLLASLAGGLAVVVAIALTYVFVIKRGPGVPVTGMIPTGSTPQQDGRQVAAAFLTDWEKGKLSTAANLTDHPAAARAALAAYAKNLGLGKVAFGQSGVADAAGSTTAQPRETDTYAIAATVSALGRQARARPRCTARGPTIPRSSPTSRRTQASGSWRGSPP